MKTLSSLIACLGLSTCSLLANAHTPFLVPVSFEPAHENWVSLDAGFAEAFFHPDVAFTGGNFQVLTPAGQWQKPAKYEEFKTRTLVEYQLSEKGTYRFSTGPRLGDVFRVYEQDGKRKITRDPKEVLPAGTKLLDHYQSLSLAETYVTLEKPSDAALKPYNKGLEVVAITPPNDFLVGEKVALRVLFDGKPLADKEASVYTAQDGNEHEKPTFTSKTNSKGELELTFPQRGVYLLHLRHTGPAPKDAGVPNYGYVYTLTFEVQPPL